MSHTPDRRTSLVPRRLLALAFALTTASAAVADTVQFATSTFGAAWTSTKILDTTPGASATFSSVTTIGDGVPPPCRQTTHNWSSGAIVVAHLDTNATYLPAGGVICSIDGAYDLIHYTDPNGAVRYRMLIYQNGTYYHDTAGTDVFPNLWASYIVNGLTPSSFTKVAGNGPDLPDFSCTGGLMTFGFTTSNSANGGPNTKVSALDNWSLTLQIARHTFFDGDFNPGWSSAKVLDTTPGGNATYGTTTQPVAGSPGAYREIFHTFDNGAIAVEHFDPANIHDPSVMPVYELDCSYTLRHFTPALGAVRFHLAIKQGGQLFVGPWDDIYANTWTNFSHTGLLASSFTNYLGGSPASPDFTVTGGILELGFLTSNSVNGGPVTKYAGIDNWQAVLALSPRCTNTTGTPYCFGDNSGPACPCFPAVGASAGGHGCPNSLFGSGALLIGQGTASIGNDTLVLQASAMPNSSCLYFQGTAASAAVAFDGLRCAAGTVIRLGSKQNICNASQFPDASDLPVHVTGAVFVPGTRYYQVWYRNPAAFCTSATANFTNGLMINWVP